MKQIFDALCACMAQGKETVLVTIVASSGSVPRGSGARMLIGPEGRICGTIGGGAVEYRSEQLAAEILRTGDSRKKFFRLFRNEVEDLGMVCGGDVEVFFRYIPANDTGVLSLLTRLPDIFTALEPSWLITEITDGCCGALSVYGTRSGLLGPAVPQAVLDGLSGRPVQIPAEGRVFYCEKLLQPGRVYIFGGGHIARALVPVLNMADFHCIVVDDRPDFVLPEDFPGAETRCMDPADLSSLLSELTPEDCICIMTRGHKDDMQVQRQAMTSPVRYIGVIGSAKKQQMVKAQILASGMTEADFAPVVSPIGIDIGAETPAEIAVSIAAQLIRVRAGRGPGEVGWKGIFTPTGDEKEVFNL